MSKNINLNYNLFNTPKLKENFCLNSEDKNIIQSRTSRINNNFSYNINSNLNSNNNNNKFEFLYNESIFRQQRIRNLSFEKEKNFEKNFPFKPILLASKSNKKYFNNNNYNDNFYNRQQNFIIKKKNDINKINEKINKIPKPKNFVSNKNYLKENSIYSNENFYKNKRDKIEKIRKELIIENGITFKPKLNKNSLNKVKNNLFERNQIFLEQKELKINQIKNNFNNNFSFKPKIIKNKSYTHIKTNINNYNNNIPIKSNSLLENRINDYEKKHNISISSNQFLKYENYNNDNLNDNNNIQNNYNNNNNNNNNKNNNNNYIINYIKEKSKKNSFDSNILSIKTLSKTNSDIVNFQSINLNKSRKASRAELNKENIINNVINNNIKNLNNFIELSESINDEKLIELAKIYLSYDESLENFLIKNKKFRKKIDLSTIANTTSKQSNSSSENLNKAKIINNLNYYENNIIL